MKRASIKALDAPPGTKRSNYPEPFASRMAGREKRPLGDLFRLANFGVNLTRLAPGAVSALRYAHLRQDEFVYVIEGHPTLVTLSRTKRDVLYLEVGDRTAGDAVIYPDDDRARSTSTRAARTSPRRSSSNACLQSCTAMTVLKLLSSP
jgi:uncharacterized cupin superfamily protein